INECDVQLHRGAQEGLKKRVVEFLGDASAIRSQLIWHLDRSLLPLFLVVSKHGSDPPQTKEKRGGLLLVAIRFRIGASRQSRLRRLASIPSLFMRAMRVVRLMDSRSAAPPGPARRPFDARKARTMRSHSSSS